MINKWSGRSLLAAMSCCLVTGGVIQAQPATSTSLVPNSDLRDFQGMWKGPAADHGFAGGFSAPPATGADGPAPVGLSTLGAPLGDIAQLMKPATAARSERSLQMMLKGTTIMSWRVTCRPPGPAQLLLGDDLGGFEIVQTPTRVLFLFDTDNTYWEVYLDRDHPKDLKASYPGHSIGRWEGDKLVIDTIGYNGRGSLIRGALSSTQAHTTTRMWKEKNGLQLKYETTVEDPVNLTRAGTFPVALVNWSPEHRIYEEHCTQSPRPENISEMIFEDFTREEAFPYLYKSK